MHGDNAFCPKNGAPLSNDSHYDERGRSWRAPINDEMPTDARCDGELSNGDLCSSKRALIGYFRRCHQHHHETDQSLYCKAALELTRLKRTANGTETWDIYIWYALSERLFRRGYDVKWMAAYGEPRCPDCAGRLKYEVVHDNLVAFCGTNCTGQRTDRLKQVCETVVGLYGRTFSDDSLLGVGDLHLL